MTRAHRDSPMEWVDPDELAHALIARLSPAARARLFKACAGEDPVRERRAFIRAWLIDLTSEARDEVYRELGKSRAQRRVLAAMDEHHTRKLYPHLVRRSPRRSVERQARHRQRRNQRPRRRRTCEAALDQQSYDGLHARVCREALVRMTEDRRWRSVRTRSPRRAHAARPMVRTRPRARRSPRVARAVLDARAGPDDDPPPGPRRALLVARAASNDNGRRLVALSFAASSIRPEPDQVSAFTLIASALDGGRRG